MRVRGRTTTKRINKALEDNVLRVAKAEFYHKTSKKTEMIDAETFLENFQFLCESGCFSECVGWHYEKGSGTGEYVIETGRMNGSSEIIIIAYMRVNDGVDEDEEDIDEQLLFTEE